MSIRDILAMLVIGFTLAWATADKGVTTEDYVGYMCLWCAGWTFTSLILLPLLKRKKD